MRRVPRAYSDREGFPDFPDEVLCVFSAKYLKRGASVGMAATMIPVSRVRQSSLHKRIVADCTYYFRQWTTRSSLQSRDNSTGSLLYVCG